ncbi:hypothetical protein IU463_29705 [Nocardia farcinica]|nr:hypothetical protein [Nocardia farcinica]
MRSQVMEMIHLSGLAIKEEIMRGLLMGVAAVMTTTRIVISIEMVMKRAMDAGNMEMTILMITGRSITAARAMMMSDQWTVKWDSWHY